MIVRHKNNFNQLLVQFPIPKFDTNNSQHLGSLNQSSINAIARQNGVLNRIPPLEKHPYLTPLIPSKEISGIMIGTFPPITYLCDRLTLPLLTFDKQKFTKPDLPYFHGNYGSLWDYSPINFDDIKIAQRDQQPTLVQQALNDRGIVYTDMIEYCQRNIENDNVFKYNASDENLYNIVINNDVFNYLFDSNSVKRIYFTNASFFGTSEELLNRYNKYYLTKNDAFQLFLKGAQDNEFKIEFSLPNQNNWENINETVRVNAKRKQINSVLQSKIYIKLRLTKNEITRVFDVVSCASPAAVNRGSLRKNVCVKNYSFQNRIAIKKSAPSMLAFTLTHFFANNLQPLIPYNQ